MSNDNWVNVAEVLEEIMSTRKLNTEELVQAIMSMQWLQGAKAALTGYKHLCALKEADLEYKERKINRQNEVIHQLQEGTQRQRANEWHRSCTYWRDQAMKLGWKQDEEVASDKWKVASVDEAKRGPVKITVADTFE